MSALWNRVPGSQTVIFGRYFVIVSPTFQRCPSDGHSDALTCWPLMFGWVMRVQVWLVTFLIIFIQHCLFCHNYKGGLRAINKPTQQLKFVVSLYTPCRIWEKLLTYMLTYNPQQRIIDLHQWPSLHTVQYMMLRFIFLHQGHSYTTITKDTFTDAQQATY